MTAPVVATRANHVVLDTLMPEPVVILLPHEAAELFRDISAILDYLERQRNTRTRKRLPSAHEQEAVARAVNALHILDRNEVNPATGERVNI